MSVHRDLIISLAVRHKLPPVYPYDYLVTAGGLMSYGLITSTNTGTAMSIVSSKGRSRGYAGAGTDKIRNGHQSQNGEALDLTVPPSLLARVNEVIE
ncbi:MAG: hypothetical protein WB686_20315 [Pseudolabrys sp.]